jgi:hypothetical protein
MKNLRIALIGAALCTAGLAACGHSASTATKTSSTRPASTTTVTASGGTTSTSSTAAPVTTAPAVTVTTSTPAPTRAAGCTSAQIATTATDNSGMGHIGVVLGFRNRSAQTCTLQGYPGAAALDAAGHQVVQAVRTLNGFFRALPAGEGPPVVTLAPGAEASAFVEGTDVPVHGTTSCPQYPKLLVTPPNTTVSVLIDTAMPGCTPVQIHPVVPGTDGSLVV